MTATIDTNAETKANLLGAVVLFDDGGSTHRAKVVFVGNTDPDNGQIFLHLSSLERFYKHRGTRKPCLFCGWRDIKELSFEPQQVA